MNLGAPQLTEALRLLVQLGELKYRAIDDSYAVVEAVDEEAPIECVRTRSGSVIEPPPPPKRELPKPYLLAANAAEPQWPVGL